MLKSQLSRGVTVAGLCYKGSEIVMTEQAKRQLSEVNQYLTANNSTYSVSYKLFDPKTDAQRKYYWGVILPDSLPALREFGFEMDTEEAHAFFKHNFLSVSRTIKIVGGGTAQIVVARSTEALTCTETIHYYNQIILFVGELGFEVRQPEDKSILKL